MKKPLIAVALLAATPTRADITDNSYIKKAGMLMAAGYLCKFENADMMTYFLIEAIDETGVSKEVAVNAATTYAYQVHDHIKTVGQKNRFCRNVYNNDF